MLFGTRAGFQALSKKGRAAYRNNACLAAMDASQSHIDEDDLLLFARGTLETDRVERIASHLAACRQCNLVLTDSRALLRALAVNSVAVTYPHTQYPKSKYIH